MKNRCIEKKNKRLEEASTRWRVVNASRRVKECFLRDVDNEHINTRTPISIIIIYTVFSVFIIMKIIRAFFTLVLFSVAWGAHERRFFSGWFGSKGKSQTDSPALPTPSPNLNQLPDSVSGLPPTPGLGSGNSAGIDSGSSNQPNAGSQADSKQAKHLSTVVVHLPDGTTKTTSGTVVVTQTVVDSYTTFIPTPTVLVENGDSYTVTAATTLTVSKCPCTREVTLLLSTATKCVCTTEVVHFEAIPTSDVLLVNTAGRAKIGALGICIGFVLAAFFV
ncbi:hypothetical protein PMAC_002883 [Pneumocystis sp. 'macacae']|nr:hypothetical protein PMAC_002883 [Pneumocystis sp. 'macacae']